MVDNVLFPLNFITITNRAPVVQSIISLTSSLRGQFKCFTTLLPNKGPRALRPKNGPQPN